MNKYLRIFFLSLIGINLVLAAQYVLHGNLTFTSDLGRDFFILQEIELKKFILIGPRSGAFGFFHGPLWAYLNFPAYWLGKGNPLYVGWFWIFLIAFFMAVYFFTAKKLFNELTAWLFILMASLYCVARADSMFNPDGALFIIPLFFYYFIQYLKTHRLRFLLIHIFLIGIIIQFQIAVGMPLAILSFGYFVYHFIKIKEYEKILSFVVLAVPLGTYVLFELRHNFTLIKFGLRQFGQHDSTSSFLDLVTNRLATLTTGINFFRFNFNNYNLYIFIIMVAFLVYEIKTNKKLRSIYTHFLYFLVGFFALSLLNRYELLYFYVYPIFLLVFLIFSSLVNSKHKYNFALVFVFVYIANLGGAIREKKNLQTEFKQKSQYTWAGLFGVASKVYSMPEQEFGYFVFSPDQFAYEPRYAMEYGKRFYHKDSVAIFQKKPVTYVVEAPENNTYISAKWWIENMIKISSPPVQSFVLDNGYVIEKYLLTEEEINMPINPDANPGLHFR